jgi:Leucine-rich repeat (LRR) protein
MLKSLSLPRHKIFVIIAVVILVCCYSAHSAADDCVGPISEVEYDALEALYDSTDGENWQWLPDGDPASRWHFPATLDEPCGTNTWEGLHCNTTGVSSTDLGCYVLGVSLEHHNLFGTVSSLLGTLTRLELLNLAYNSLTGSLPGEVGGMSSLISMDLQRNYIVQQLPTELGLLTTLELLYLDFNQVGGTIPPEIGNMTHLLRLYLYFNYLHSTIPSELGLLTALDGFDLYSNDLTGTVPSEICGMKLLTQFYVVDNHLSGPIPPCFGDLIKLERFLIYNNFVSGQLPSQMGNMLALAELSCESNLLTGQIPTQLFGLSSVTQFLFTGNWLSGTLAPHVSSLASVNQFELGANQISGVIPSELFTLENLATLFLAYNLFSGTIPGSFSESTSVEFVEVSYNRLSGTLPNLARNTSRLQYLTVASNYLSGNIPLNLLALKDIQELSFFENLFTGTVALSAANSSGLELLNLWGCLLTGRFPDGFSDLAKLKSFTTQSNYLSGSVTVPVSPTSIILQDLEIGDNFLSGSLPAAFANFRRLEEFDASHNLFTGHVDFLFNGSTAAELDVLEYIDLSNNAFSGSIPESMFAGARLRPLNIVVLYQNCFTGSLPSAICEAGNLTTLILDSVSSAPACDVRFTGFWKDLFKVVIGKRSLQGTIPSCIWSMRSLETLHLAGNGLAGVLPHDLQPVMAMNRTIYGLNDVNLASNVFSGSIPLSWQEWPWKSLDLSGNKLNGILSEGFVVNNTCSESEEMMQSDDDYYIEYFDDGGSSSSSATGNSTQLCGTVDLTVNRLSGRIPTAFRFAEGVNILDGNLFDCRAETIPVNDPVSAQYICGSDDFNDSLILWICVWVVAAGLLASFSNANLWPRIKSLRIFLASETDAQREALGGVGSSSPARTVGSLVPFLSFLRRVATLSLILQTFYLCVCMMSYLGMKASNWHLHEEDTGSGYVKSFTLSTHTYQYAWLSTAAYLHGSMPVAVVLTYLFLSLLFVGCFFASARQAATIKQDEALQTSSRMPSYPARTTSIRLAAYKFRLAISP